MAGESLFFDSVSVGDLVPEMKKGPHTTAHLMRWSSAIENWHRIHYDHDFAINHDKLPDLLINGSLKQQFLFEFLQSWVGGTGWVWKVRFQFRAMSEVGQPLFLWGRVTEKQEHADFGLVTLDLGIRNADGRESTPGGATVALPYRDGNPLPYPFQIAS